MKNGEQRILGLVLVCFGVWFVCLFERVFFFFVICLALSTFQFLTALQFACLWVSIPPFRKDN